MKMTFQYAEGDNDIANNKTRVHAELQFNFSVSGKMIEPEDFKEISSLAKKLKAIYKKYEEKK